MKLKHKLTTLFILPFLLGGCSSKSVSSESVESSETSEEEVDTTRLAREAAVDSKVEVNGIVSTILQGQSGACGYYLLDKTGSIYVYDTINAPTLNVGDNVHIAGTRTNHILESEQTAAEKFGYEGAIQISDVTSCVKNDEETHSIPTEGAIESNMHDILNTPLTNNITSQVFYVTAYIKKVAGTGYTNYYIDDLDGKTGSYVYTQKNGADYEWLNAYDMKVMDILVAPHNVKCSGTGFNYRLTPIAILSEYTGSDQNKVENIARIIYYTQFEETYKANPRLELITTYDSEILNESGFTAKYTSNSSSVSVENNILNIDVSKDGSASINVEVSLREAKTNKDVSFNIEKVNYAEYNAKTCKEACDLGLEGAGSEITVSGVAASTMTNNGYGYYIVDKTGLICVILTDKTEFEKISVGNTVILKGTTDLYGPNTSTNHTGWARITGATVEYTDYGNSPIDQTCFKDSTVSELASLPGDPNPSVNGYKVTAKITIVGSNYYTNYYITDKDDDSIKVLLYAGNGKSVWGSKLDEYEGKVVELLYTPQIMKGANNWRGYVVSVLRVVE